jgi:copper transport protein
VHLGVTRSRLGVAAASVLVLLVAWATPAFAHAAVLSSTPSQGAHLQHVPHTVTISFDQPVRPDAGGLVVLDSGGQRVEIGSGHPSPAVLTATLPSSLGQGAYVANYTVTSVDGHVVSGGIVFLVGNVKAGAISGLTRPRTSLTNWVDDAGQFLTYVGVLVAAGLVFFLTFLLADGSERKRLGRWAVTAAGIGVLGMFVTIGAQVVLAGGGLSSLGHWTYDNQAVDSKLGAQCGLQLVGLAACLASLRVRNTLACQFMAFYGLLVAAGAFVVFGHAVVSPERWLSIPADIVHAVFAAMWAGGLVGLVAVLHSRLRAAARAGEMATPGRSPRELESVSLSSRERASGGASGRAPTALLERPSPSGSEGGSLQGGEPGLPPDRGLLNSTIGLLGRFSTMAAISVASILVAGVLLSIAEVGSFANLFETGYGQLLLVKIGLVGLLLFLAAYNRFLLLPWLFATSADSAPGAVSRGWRRLRATVRWEAVGMIAVLAVTSVLANGTPSNGATAPPPVPFAQSQPFEGGHVSLKITPNQALVNDWTVQFTGPNGAPADLAESVSLYLVLPSQNIGPIEVDMQRVGVGAFSLPDSPNPPVVGEWQVVLQIQVSEFSQQNASFTDTVQ